MTPMQGPRRAALAAMLAASAGLAGAACETQFPTARVTEKLADPRYQHCRHVAQDYAAQLVEQESQLKTLRPAYGRKLERDEGTGDDAKARVQLRLDRYDTNRGKLLAAAAALRPYPEVAGTAASASAVAAALGQRSAARQRLKDAHMVSQALNASIADAASVFGADETGAYCKQDYAYRVGAGLQALLAACLKDE
ncbi:MAG: hypothetical protein KF683_20285 [Rubrivivax sp.]|nr:hypothetical protein [Rubrivivax sp.]